jgi:nucleoside-diphosphate-sugar epimerase
MKIFLAGATGAIGKRLVPMLASAGHQVVGMTRTAAKTDALRAAGAQPVVADALDAEAVRRAVVGTHPTVVVHQMTALAKLDNPRNFDRDFALTNRLRTVGTQYLLSAAQETGAKRFIAQSYAGWPNERNGSRIKSEEDPLNARPPKAMAEILNSIRQLEQMVSSAAGLTGIVLRYGSFYGPGTSMGEGGGVIETVRRRKFPLFGDGAGVWSFIHIDDAANATRIAIENGEAGTYNIVDNEPAEVSTWLPDLAQALGAKPPLRLPAWLGWLMIGDAGLYLMTKARGSSNAKAKRVLGWQPFYSSWRDGFRHGLSGEPGKMASLRYSEAPRNG